MTTAKEYQSIPGTCYRASRQPDGLALVQTPAGELVRRWTYEGGRLRVQEGTGDPVPGERTVVARLLLDLTAELAGPGGVRGVEQERFAPAATAGRWVGLATTAEWCRDCLTEQARGHQEGRCAPQRRKAAWWWVPAGDTRDEREALAAAGRGEELRLVCNHHKIIPAGRGQRR